MMEIFFDDGFDEPEEYHMIDDADTPLLPSDLEPFFDYEPCPKCDCSSDRIKITCLNVRYLPSEPQIPYKRLDNTPGKGYIEIEFDYLRLFCMRCGFKRNCMTADAEGWNG